MDVFEGKSVFGAIAIGPLSVLIKGGQQVKRRRIEDAEAEVKRFHQGREEAVKQLGVLYDKALVEVGETNAMIFEIHQMMLADGDYVDAIENIIRLQQVNAEYAVATTADNFAQVFSAMDDAYMRERAADVRDISERVVNILAGEVGDGNSLREPVIILAEDLAPSETVQLDKDMVLAFVTRQGSSNSHTAILARTMNIPAVMGVDLEVSAQYEGRLAIVDGFTGKVYIDPDEETLADMQARQLEERRKRELLTALKGKESVTPDGQKINLYANIGSEHDLAAVLQNDAEGIGLFRSEFLYLEREDYPTEEEQFKVYRQVLETMAGKPVIIRTLDIGADKQIGYFDLEREENPAMGYRAIRICLDRPEIFRTQLRALYRASAYGNLAIMFPMIISVAEVKAAKEMAEQVKAELSAEGIPWGEVELGVMIETPAAVMISDLLAQEVDFFSIGTNDLTQYTLAIDRQNPKLDKLYDPHHPAVLRMIRTVVENAHSCGIWAGICGELGADLTLLETFLQMGVDELSVSPSFVLPLRNKVRKEIADS